MSTTAPKNRSQDELKLTIDDLRGSLSQTLQTLNQEAQPQVQAQKAKDATVKKLEECRQEAVNTSNGALQGDRDSIIRIAKLLGVSAGVIALLILRAKRRKVRREEVRQWRRLVHQLGRITPPASLTITVE